MKRIIALWMAVWVVVMRPIVLFVASVMGFLVIVGTVVFWISAGKDCLVDIKFFWAGSWVSKSLLAGAIVGTAIVGAAVMAFLALVFVKPPLLWIGQLYSHIKWEYKKRL